MIGTTASTPSVNLPLPLLVFAGGAGAMGIALHKNRGEAAQLGDLHAQLAVAKADVDAGRAGAIPQGLIDAATSVEEASSKSMKIAGIGLGVALIGIGWDLMSSGSTATATQVTAPTTITVPGTTVTG